MTYIFLDRTRNILENYTEKCLFYQYDKNIDIDDICNKLIKFEPGYARSIPKLKILLFNILNVQTDYPPNIWDAILINYFNMPMLLIYQNDIKNKNGHSLNVSYRNFCAKEFSHPSNP